MYVRWVPSKAHKHLALDHPAGRLPHHRKGHRQKDRCLYVPSSFTEHTQQFVHFLPLFESPLELQLHVPAQEINALSFSEMVHTV